MTPNKMAALRVILIGLLIIGLYLLLFLPVFDLLTKRFQFEATSVFFGLVFCLPFFVIVLISMAVKTITALKITPLQLLICLAAVWITFVIAWKVFWTWFAGNMTITTF